LLDYLHNKIDICKEPFSDIGSRLLVFQQPEKCELFIKLAERLTGLESGLGTYLFRPPFIQDLHFVDNSGNPLEFKLTTSPDCLKFETELGLFQMVFQDVETILIGLPDSGAIGVQFIVNHSINKLNESGAEIKHVRNFSYKTNAEIIKNEMKPVLNGIMVDLLVEPTEDQSIAFRISPQNDLSLVINSFKETAANAKSRWARIFNSVPIVMSKYQEKYAFAWWVLLNNIVSPQGFLTRNTVMPSKAYYIGAWLWDSALHAIALSNLDSNLAQDQIKLFYDHQLSDGMLPDAIYDEGIVAEIDHPIKARVTKPPIMAWAVGKLFEKNPDKLFIEQIYPQLVRENAWWFSQNDLDANGLVEYAHPYSSGLDDSPLWDGEMPVESPDINTYLYLQMENLAWMAEILEKSEEAFVWKFRSKALLERLVSVLWDEKKGLFLAKHDGQPVDVVTPFNLFPLWTGNLPEDKIERIVSNLVDPELFWNKHAMPTVAFNDEKFDPNKMWRGPIWANINYFIIEALQRNNKSELARQLREKTLELIANSPGIYEYYNPITGNPPHTAAPVFSWTAAVFIELTIQATFDTIRGN